MYVTVANLENTVHDTVSKYCTKFTPLYQSSDLDRTAERKQNSWYCNYGCKFRWSHSLKAYSEANVLILHPRELSPWWRTRRIKFVVALTIEVRFTGRVVKIEPVGIDLLKIEKKLVYFWFKILNLNFMNENWLMGRFDRLANNLFPKFKY
jgi:hypothetical protein